MDELVPAKAGNPVCGNSSGLRQVLPPSVDALNQHRVSGSPYAGVDPFAMRTFLSLKSSGPSSE